MGGIATQFEQGKPGSNGKASGGRRRRSGRSTKRSKKREPRECPPDWISKITLHFAELFELVIEWQRGSGDYLPMDELGAYQDTWVFAEDAGNTRARKKLSAEQVASESEEMGQSIWDYCCHVTDAEGPTLNFALVGTATSRNGDVVELFRVARRCDLRSEQGIPIAPDADGKESDSNAALRWSTTSNRDLMGNFIKLSNSLADPMKEIGGLIREAAATHRAGAQGLEDVIREKADLELLKLKKQLSLKRLEAGERLAKQGLDIIAGDIGGHLLTLAYMKYGGEPAPVSCIDACVELATSFPVACMVWLDDMNEDLGHDLMSAFAAGARAGDENEVAAIFSHLRPRLAPHTQGVRGRLRRRQLTVFDVLKGRLQIYQVDIG